jgi:hypothetical protein
LWLNTFFKCISLRSVTASRVPQTIWYNYRNNCIK